MGFVIGVAVVRVESRKISGDFNGCRERERESLVDRLDLTRR